MVFLSFLSELFVDPICRPASEVERWPEAVRGLPWALAARANNSVRGTLRTLEHHHTAYQRRFAVLPSTFAVTTTFFIASTLILPETVRLVGRLGASFLHTPYEPLLGDRIFFLCLPFRNADFAGGKAHQGISQSAVRVWTAVKGEVEKQLREHSDYKLVLTGDWDYCLPVTHLVRWRGRIAHGVYSFVFSERRMSILTEEKRRSQATATTTAQVGVYGGRKAVILCVLLVRCCRNGG